MNIQVEGAKEAAAAIDRIINGLESRGELDFAVAAAARDEGATYAGFIVPKDTGALGQAQGVFVEGETIIIGTDPEVVNPKSRTLPADYGPIVAATHFDFYGQVVDDRADAIVERAFDEFVQAVTQ